VPAGTSITLPHVTAAVREIAFEASEQVRETLASLGRTEDVRLSPSRGRVALACYSPGAIAVGDIELATSPSGPDVTLTRLELLSSPLLREPHGLDWRGDDTLVVANRAGHLSVIRLEGEGVVEVSSVPTDSPGSVALRPVGDGRHEAVVCGNWQSSITTFELDENDVLAGGIPLLQRWLDLPDGIAVAATGRWLAVSNHNTHTVLVFDAKTAREDADPIAVLRGVEYPHGLRFAADDRLLLVADAGAPNVHVFATTDGSWAIGAAYPAATVRVLDDATFARGHRTPMEGGPKGIDLDARTGVLLVTCEELALGVFDVSEVLTQPARFGTDGGALLRYELAALASAEAEREAAADVRAQLAAVTATKAWRLTAPARRLQATLLAARRHRSQRADAAPGTSSVVPD
jgi:lipoprotein LpqB-like beta-propeller protein